MAKSFLNNPNYSRGLRNNNPGNLVYTNITWTGKVPKSLNKDANQKFEQFYELRYGIRALMRDLISDVAKPGQNTLIGLIHSYAPAFENDTMAYINSVAKSVGISPNAKIELTEQSLVVMCKAIIYVENGAANARLITDADYNDALAILGKNLKKKKV